MTVYRLISLSTANASFAAFGEGITASGLVYGSETVNNTLVGIVQNPLTGAQTQYADPGVTNTIVTGVDASGAVVGYAFTTGYHGSHLDSAFVYQSTTFTTVAGNAQQSAIGVYSSGTALIVDGDPGSALGASTYDIATGAATPISFGAGATTQILGGDSAGNYYGNALDAGVSTPTYVSNGATYQATIATASSITLDGVNGSGEATGYWTASPTTANAESAPVASALFMDGVGRPITLPAGLNAYSVKVAGVAENGALYGSYGVLQTDGRNDWSGFVIDNGAVSTFVDPTSADVNVQGMDANGDVLISDSASGYYFASPTALSGDQTVICFLAGTMIATPEGERAIETLRRGDLVITHEGSAAPVCWLGKQTVSRRFADPVRVNPIRIRAHALAENVPSRDLLVSPDHALLVGGVLVHAGALVNGSSITRETPPEAEAFVYYHVELDDHALILAENTPAETFIDNVERMAFDNWTEHEALYPQGKALTEMPYPRAKARRQVPQSLRATIDARARALGLACAEVA